MTDQGQAVATTPSDRQAGVRIDVQALTRTVRAKDRRELTLLDARLPDAQRAEDSKTRAASPVDAPEVPPS
jgi:hypothetical protein